MRHFLLFSTQDPQLLKRYNDLTIVSLSWHYSQLCSSKSYFLLKMKGAPWQIGEIVVFLQLKI